ncbi:hypothetical protein M0804_002570 [Polistes exclamans]|nr:hypothetical protein M0804_002570 [Polistes exclamans]
MNDPLDNDIKEFGLSTKGTNYKDSNVDLLQAFDEQIDKQSPSHDLSSQLFNCEICEKQFATKKLLKNHIFTHLGRARVVLKRVSNLKVLKRKHSDTYFLSSEKSQSLKLKLKKTTYTDPLKLTLKKSSVSEDFIVVSTNHSLNTINFSAEDVAGEKDRNEQSDAEETDNSIKQTFENVMVDQQDDYENAKFESDNDNSLEENERPSLDINEGDSGVGSDMANPSEKEDQNVDDLHGSDNYNNTEKRLSEIEDHEESDALEATCRETIENLKKLGEQSSSRSINQLINNSSVDEDNDTVNEVDMLHDLEENPAISIISKSSTFSNHSVSEDDPKQAVVETETGFNWNQLSTDLTHKDKLGSKENEDHGENSNENNIENSTSLLHNFLMERRDHSELISSSLPPVETEYVSLEKLAETVSMCRVCNEKFKDITHLDEHRSKVGHYQCNIPDCANLIFHSPVEVSMHKSQVHGTSLSPSVSQLSPHLNTNSPHLNQNSPHLRQASPQLNTHSPHPQSMESPSQLSRNSPLTAPHQTNSPTYNAVTSNTTQQIIPPVSFDQLPAPVQQLAQQVQRMPLPQTQLPPSLPPGANTMIPGTNYFVPPPGRPPLYRISGPHSMHYQSHLSHLYPQYGPGPYPQMTGPPQMHPQLSQQMSRGRYPSVAQNTRLDIIVTQIKNDGLPVIQNVQGATTQQTTNRNDSTIHLTDSITLSVRQPGSTPAQLQNTSNPGSKKSDAKAVANVLAARGITVTPAANKNKASEQSKQQSPVSQQRPTTQQSLNVPALNLNSAISIIPASQKKQQEQGQFAVPQNKQNKSLIGDVERPPRPPTVDLTQDNPPQVPVIRRGRPPRTLLTCQMCEKSFQNQDMLTQHMATHRSINKLLHKCNLCSAQYPTAQALVTHKQTYHKEVETLTQTGSIELAIPVVDLKSPHVLNRLTNLGIQSYIPLSQLSAQTGGYFGLPIITIDGARNPNTCNLGALGATSILSLGPLKHLSNR